MIPNGLQRRRAVVLDEALLKGRLAETEQVIMMLGKAMLEAPTPEPTAPPVALPVSDDCLETLDVRYHAMLAQLLSRVVWQRREFNSLARSCNVMPSGALDAVNTWAYELFDDPLVIEQGEQLAIQTHLIETQ